MIKKYIKRNTLLYKLFLYYRLIYKEKYFIKRKTYSQCGEDLFMPSMRFRKISKLLTGTPKDTIIPIEVYVCVECGTVNTELLPDELKNLK